MQNTNTFLTLVKTTNSYVSQFVGSTSDPGFTKGLVESYPTIYKNGNSFFIDYSETTNTSDLKFFKRFFGSLTGGNTFTVSGGTYYIQNTGQQLNFGGTYTFYGATGLHNQYINLGGITFSTSLSDGVYPSINFTTALNYNFSTGATAQYYISKVNKNDPFNLEFLGIYGNDYDYEEYLEIAGASTNSLRYKIDSSLKLNDGSEVVYINSESSISNENLYFVPCNVNVYMRGVPDLVTLSQNKNLNGILKKIDSYGNTVEILSNQNVHQRYCRSIAYPTFIYDWYAAYRTSNYKNIFNPLAYNGLSVSITHFAYAKIQTVVTTSNVINEITGTFQQTNTNALSIDGVITQNVSYTSPISVTNPVLKIDLSDSSLFSSTVEPYIDSECSSPLSVNYFLNGVPGFDGASFVFLKRENSPSTIFLKFVRETPLVLRIEMN